MVVKRGTTEDGYVVALQHLSDRVRVGLPEPQCPVVEPHTRWEPVCIPNAMGSHGCGFCRWYALSHRRCVANALKGMNGAPTSL
jgi:hypothetical protein